MFIADIGTAKKKVMGLGVTIYTHINKCYLFESFAKIQKVGFITENIIILYP